ncbi:Uma2 family endonuclease [Spirosoma sp. KNUC1025]|uniref:Uma2 family endonuclease n=1 Tax=Spirosoma sp. KNUC1025 TaxID=2894082 RepID=UPI0038703894|nr:Uma2 family endonuclease [Spirosoma sp. KNUC1025]
MESVAEISDYELERGKPMPSKNHGKLQFRIAKAISDNTGERFDILTEVSLELSRPVTPDIALFPAEPSDWLEDEIKVKKPPLSVVEILSPTQGNQELIDKLDIYFAAGVQSCWIVIPTFRLINVFTAKHDYKTFLTGELFDEKLDIRVNLDLIFR